MLMPSVLGLGNSLFDDFFDGFDVPAYTTGRYNIPSNEMMRTDVKENKKGYEMDITLPGYKKEDIKAELKDGYLTISAETNNTNEEKDNEGKYIRKERYTGKCSRSFYVGEQIEQQDIDAKFEDGILKLFIPKKEKKPQIESKKLIQIQ